MDLSTDHDEVVHLPHPAATTKMPARIRLLHVAHDERRRDWLAEALSKDHASEIQFHSEIGAGEGLARLGEEIFDVVLVGHEPGQLDALELIEGLRTGGSEDAIVVLGTQSEQDMAPLCHEVGADAYVCIGQTTTRALLWIVARAIEHQRLRRENQRLAHAERHRLRLEQNEIDRLVGEQRSLVQLDGESNEPAVMPSQLVEHYRELLRTHIIMGSGSLRDEMARLGELLSTAAVSPHRAVQMHLAVLEELLRGLGSRSARHVLARADLLIFEILVHLSENYRRRWLDRDEPQLPLSPSGFDSAARENAA